MTSQDLRASISAALRAQGAGDGGALVGLGRFSAFPHGSIAPQKLREGDIVLIDGGCHVEGYESDITRTTVFGKPNARQKQIWDLDLKPQNPPFPPAQAAPPSESLASP